MEDKGGVIAGVMALYLALLVLLLPFRWLLVMTVAALVHELGHYAAVRCFGGKIHRFRIGFLGANLEAADLNTWQSVLCILSGPLAGLLLLFLIRVFPRLAICGVLQSVYNLLPIYPLDGGRVLRAVFGMVGLSDKICTFVETSVTVLLLAIAVYGAIILQIGWFPVLAVSLLLLRARLEKYLAKRRYLRYNSIVQP